MRRTHTPPRRPTLLGLALLTGCGQHRICPGAGGDRAAFHEMWSLLDRRYAVFAERLDGQSWEDVGQDACPALDGRTSKNALYDVMLDTLQVLDDGHTVLHAPKLGRHRDAWVSAYPHYPALYSLEGRVEDILLDEDLRWAARDWVAWGRIGGVGYLSLTSFDGLSRGGGQRSDVAAIRSAMDQVLDDLGHLDGMVVDVRANEGGWDTAALEVARRFEGPRSLAFAKQTRNGPDHSDLGPWKEAWVDASEDDAYTGEVVVLTSGGTFSAAEIFVLAMGGRDHVTVLGEPTSGHLSDIHTKRLDSGWAVDFSGERYRDVHGDVHEARGVPVDQHVELDVDALADGRDVQLLAALDRHLPTTPP